LFVVCRWIYVVVCFLLAVFSSSKFKKKNEGNRCGSSNEKRRRTRIRRRDEHARD
jgi:hypothetical protein